MKVTEEEVGRCAVAASYRVPAFPSEYRGPLLTVVFWLPLVFGLGVDGSLRDAVLVDGGTRT